MLKRTLEPEVMDSAQEAQEYNEMDHSEVNRKFVDELLEFASASANPAHEGQPMLGDVLDLGTGTALIPIHLCQAHDDCRVMGIDMAISMLELARYNIEAKGMRERISLAQIDAKRLVFEDGMFDSVISNSIVHHIPEPLKCLSEMVRVTSVGGLIFVRDLMRPSDLATLEMLVETYAGQESEYSRGLFRDSLHAALSIDEIREMIASLGFDPETVQPSSDRHWTWATRKLDA